MKNIFVIAVLLGAGYLGYQKFIANPMIGKWKSDKELTLIEWENDNVNSALISNADFMLGKMELDITSSLWSFDMDGEFVSEEYNVISKDGNCQRIRMSNQTTKVCIEDDKLYVTVDQLKTREVFSRI